VNAPVALARTASPPPPLHAPFAEPPDGAAIAPRPATRRLVRTQVRGLLEATPSFHALPADERGKLEKRLNHVAAYAAECLRDIWWQSEKLGQRPVLKEQRAAPSDSEPPALATAQANDFDIRAAGKIAQVTQQTLRAIAFPTFVADLIRGTFDAITRTNLQQMEAFSELLRNVSKTVDDFMQDNVSDEQAHSWLAEKYPSHLTMRNGKAVARPKAGDLPPPDFQRELNVSGGLDDIDDTLLPAARRRLAETRLQMLSTMVLMGINRIVITSGRIRATMGFHIDTSDSAFDRTAEDLDARVAMRGHVNALMWGLEASASLAYVSSKRAGSDAEMNVETDLTGEVELNFKSDYFPAERFATQGVLSTISNNTGVPSANPPPMAPPVAPPARQPRRARESPPALPPMRSAASAPLLPTAPAAAGSLDPAGQRKAAPAGEQKETAGEGG
jgi:hypothetical protein